MFIYKKGERPNPKKVRTALYPSKYRFHLFHNNFSRSRLATAYNQNIYVPAGTPDRFTIAASEAGCALMLLIASAHIVHIYTGTFAQQIAADTIFPFGHFADLHIAISLGNATNACRILADLNTPAYPYSFWQKFRWRSRKSGLLSFPHKPCPLHFTHFGHLGILKIAGKFGVVIFFQRPDLENRSCGLICHQIEVAVSGAIKRQ